jgi:hypothetical protein
MKHRSAWLLLALLFALFGVTAFHALRARLDSGKDLPAYSVWSRDITGLAEAARMFRHLGLEPVAVTRPMLHLPSQDRPRLLILVEPQSGSGEPDLSEADAKGLLRWVEQGNTLLLVGRHGTPIHRELGVALRSEASIEDTTVRDAVADEAGGYTNGVDALAVEGIDSVQAAEGLPLYRLNGKPGAVLVRRGTGRVLVMADPSPLTERGLGRRDNFWFLRNVAALHARDGRVYFDEYHHGIRAGGGFWAYLREQGQMIALLPVLLAAAIALWAVAVRLGPAVPQPEAIRADAVDYASALSRIYQQAGTRGLLARGLARDFLATLLKHLRLRRNATDAQIVTAWRSRHPGATGDQMARLLPGLAELRGGDVSERQLLEWTRAFDRFVQEMK